MGIEAKQKESFNDILRGKMALHAHQDPSFSVKNPSSYISFIDQSTSLFTLIQPQPIGTSRSKYHQYPSKKTRYQPKTELFSKASITKKIIPAPCEIVYKVNHLSVAGQLALSILEVKFIDGAIRISEIKTAYRRLARKLHPDLNPSLSDKAFTDVKQAYDIVMHELRQLTL